MPWSTSHPHRPRASAATVLTAIVAIQLSMDMVPAAAIGVVAFFVVGVALFLFGYRSQEMARLLAAHDSTSVPSAPTSPES